MRAVDRNSYDELYRSAPDLADLDTMADERGDPSTALDWLERAFGFETRIIVDDGQGGVIHSETVFGDGMVLVVGPPRDKAFSPESFAGRHSGSIHIQLQDGIDAHCERARAAGARIDREPEDQPYGDRVYTCADPEGHTWSFGQTLRVMTREEIAAATGRQITEGALR